MCPPLGRNDMSSPPRESRGRELSRGSGATSDGNTMGEEVEEGVDMEESEDLFEDSTRTPQDDCDEWGGGSCFRVKAIEAVQYRRGVPYYLVEWEGLPPKAKTYEPKENLTGPTGAAAIESYLEVQVRVDNSVAIFALLPCDSHHAIV